MAVAEVQGIEGLKELMGREIGPGAWREVTQRDIDLFADLSGDHQWIHTDVERAKTESPFGTTVAHGNLTLSLIDGLRLDLISSSGFALGVNYGWNKVRFPAPVPAGSRVRASAEGQAVGEAGGGGRRGGGVGGGVHGVPWRGSRARRSRHPSPRLRAGVPSPDGRSRYRQGRL